MSERGFERATRLTDDDLHLFNEGTHYRLHHKLGAHVNPAGGVDFAVWAPNAAAVEIAGDWNGWLGGTPLHARGSSGIWVGHDDRAAPEHRYKLRITARDGQRLEKADPFAIHAEVAPATASIIWNGDHTWGDGAWMKSRHERARLDAPWSIYEVHLGSWMREHGNHGRALGYRELGERLAEHAGRTGFTHVELMPVMEHPFYGSWGYQVTGYFAPTSRYGRPEDLMALVDTLHQAGIGVVLDWVPAHFPTDGHGLGWFDGTHLFEHADPRRGFHPDWTTFIFNFSRHEVRSFLISSAFSWFERFHVDGLRVDGVASMLYRDYSRQPGEWVADIDGSNHDRDAIRFLQQLNTAVYGAYPDVQMIAEESTAWGGVSRPPEHGGLGFGMKWDMGWMHDTLEYMRREAVHRRWHHEQLTFRAIYAEHENFVLPLSHDEVVHGKGALVSKLPGDDWQRHANLRLLYGYQWALPGKKLLFMGGELATTREWNQDDVLDWQGLDSALRSGVLNWVRDVNAIYRRHPALHRRDCKPGALEWLVPDDRDNSVLVFQRNGDGDDPPVVVACNFTPVPRHGYRIGVSRGGAWREVLNSDSAIYGGSDVGNLGGVVTSGEAWHGKPASIALTLPPLGCVYLAWEPQ